MKAYLDILHNILENGTPKQPVRFDVDGIPIPVANGTIGTFAEIFRHDMSRGFPLLTTKKMAFKTLRVELEGFIKGMTNKKWYQDRGCHIWDEWANPETVEEELETAKWDCRFQGGPPYGEDEAKIAQDLRTQVQTKCSDLGPIYGYQWRQFGENYGDDVYMGVRLSPSGIRDGEDQLFNIADRLRQNPYDRRMVCSAWNPNQIHQMALPPCHFAWNVVVYEDKLNLIWHQRSVDTFLGASFNIASYGLLLLLLCKESGLKPGELVGTFNDCHIYLNHIDAVKEQLSRTPRKLPMVTIPDNNWNGIFNWTHNDIIIEGYNPYPAIKAEVTV